MLAGEIFWYAVGRFYAWPDGTVQDVGYFARLGELDPMFTGSPMGPSTACFTFYAARFTPVPLSFDVTPPSRVDAFGSEVGTSAAPPAFSASLDPPGEFTLHYDPTASARFDDPSSFGRGRRLATFERIGNVVGSSTATGGANLFSARLVDSVPVDIDGRLFDLGQALGTGITQMGSAGPPATQTINGESIPVRDFVGSAMRI